MTTSSEQYSHATRLLSLLRTRQIDRREFVMMAGGIGSAALLAACSEPSGGSSSGRLTVPFYTTESNPDTLAFFSAAIASFQADHPDVDIPITLYQDEDRFQYLTTAFQTGTDLGIFVPPASEIANWAREGVLLPLTDIVESVGVDDFAEGTRVVVDGDDYAFPFQANSHAIYYRRDLLDSIGMSVPTTYDDFLAAAQAINGRDGVVGIASPLDSTPQLPLQFITPYLHQSGWSYFSRHGELRFDRQEVLAAIERYVAIMKNTTQNFYNTGLQDVLNTYIAGKALFATYPGRLGITLADQAPDIAEVTGVMPIPAGDFMTGELHFGASSFYTVSAETGQPELAQEFLASLVTGDNGLAFALTAPGHLLSPLQSVQGSLLDADDDYVVAHRDWVQTFVDILPGSMNPSLSMGAVDDHEYAGKISNVCPWANQVWTSPPIDGTMLQEILINGQEPEQAWSAACAQMEEIATGWLADNSDWQPDA